MMDHLNGIRVVEFSQYIAATSTGAQLAALGADVVKVEPKQGEACRHLGTFGLGMLNANNGGKRSIAMDLRTPEGVEVAKELVRDCDVLIHNMRPGAMDRLGLGVAAARALNPRLVYASITGFGTNGPSAHRPGLDIAAQAESGMMWTVGERGGDPLRVTPPVIDAAAAYVLTQAILAALFRRERTGEGQPVEVSLLDVAIHLQSTTYHEYRAGGPEPCRSGNGQAGAAPAADLIRAADGFIVLSAYTTAAWTRLCHLLKRPELLDDSRFSTSELRVKNRSELLAILNRDFERRGAEEAVAWLSSEGIVAGAVRSYPQVLAAADVAAAGMVQGLDGFAPFTIAMPYTFGGCRPRADGPVPDAGADNETVLADLGYDSARIQELMHAGVLRGSSST